MFIRLASYSILVLALSIAAIHARATIVPSLDVSGLAERSDVVAVGRVMEVRGVGRTVIEEDGVSAALMQATLKVDKLLKGDSLVRDLSFHFVLPDAPIGYSGIGKGQYGIFFLDASSSEYRVHDPYHPSLIASPGAPKAGGSDLDQIMAELAHTAVSGSGPSQVLTVRTLRTLRSAEATAALRRAAGSDDQRTSCAALAALLARGEISVLAESVHRLMHPIPNIDPNSLDDIAYGIREGIKDPEAVSVIEPLLHDPHTIYRLAAVTALRNTNDSRAIDALTEALGDSDQHVLYQAVAGLGEITRQDDWTPSIDYFNQNQDRFLQHWREWAQSRKP